MSDDAMEPPEQRSRPAHPRHPIVEALQARLSLPIVKDDISLAALTHKSFVNEHRGEGLLDNERLEFLGDAVIDLAVSHRLMERFPEAREGELSKIRAAVVDEAGLARMARELDLGALLRLGRGEELTGGRQKSSLLADAMEAVVAALYLGGGLEPVLCLLDRFLGDAFARAAAGTLDRDYKTQLQELAQSRLRASPRYRVIAEHGPDHSKVFEVELEIKGEVIGRGEGRSKKDAEQAAAKLALETMNGRLAEVKAAPEEAALSTPESVPRPEPPAVLEAEPPPPQDVATPSNEQAAPPLASLQGAAANERGACGAAAVDELAETEAEPPPPQDTAMPTEAELAPAETPPKPASRRQPRKKPRTTKAPAAARARKKAHAVAVPRSRARKPAKK
jgi:ribonuclease-3